MENQQILDSLVVSRPRPRDPFGKMIPIWELLLPPIFWAGEIGIPHQWVLIFRISWYVFKSKFFVTSISPVAGVA